MKLKMQGVGKGAIIDEYADEKEIDVFGFKSDEE